MEQTTQTMELIAFCGLFCAECPKYARGKCPGCRENTKASWCKIRTCGLENGIANCSECKSEGIEECKIYNNAIGKVFSILFNSDRHACIRMIKQDGAEAFVNHIGQNHQMTFKRRAKKER